MPTEPPLNKPACVLRLLGTPRIEGAEGVLEGGVVQRHRIALLALLALAPRGLLPRDRLLGLLWPESSSTSARNLLNASVRAVRRSLGEQVLITQGTGLLLDTSRIRIDVLEFETALRKGQIASALDLYAGPFLDGLALPDAVEFERWQDRERDRLERLYRSALEQQAESVARQQGPAAAVEWWLRRLACTPAEGRIVLRLMQALVAAGDRAGAMRAAFMHATLLHEEFSSLPDPDVARFVEEIQRGSSALATSMVTAPFQFDRPGVTGVDRTPAGQILDAAPEARTVLSTVVRGEASHDTGLSGARTRHGFAFGRRAATVALSAAVLAATAFAAFATFRPRPGRPIDPDAILVAPFRVTAPDPSLGSLREGVVDMLSAQLTGDGVPRAIDGRATIAAWRRLMLVEGSDLPTDRFLALAEQFGAGQLLLGELLASGSGMRASARILSVPDGRILAEHSESAAGNELDLINRLIGRLLAERAGEAEPRLRALSESEDAVRAYIAAMEAHRHGRYPDAYELFGRALDLDPQFAIAALRRIESADHTPSGANILEANLAAWRLRDLLSERDRAILHTGWAIGPNYPLPSTTAELIAALEHAAALNPDRPEAWLRLGWIQLIYGAAASIVAPLERAVAAIDSAIALDSTFVPALHFRLWAALEAHDTAAIRRVGTLYGRTQRDAPLATVHNWLVARALGDTASLDSLGRRAYEATDVHELWFHTARGAVEGYSLAGIDSAVLHAVRVEREPVRRQQLILAVVGNAGIRGRPVTALAWADSLMSRDDPHAAMYVITLAAADSGYEAAADRAAEILDAFADSVDSAGWRANALCYAELWRSLRGNASAARRTAHEIRQLVRDFDPAPFPRVGRMDVCPLLLEAAADWSSSSSARPVSLDRLDALMQQGVGLELPGHVANLLVGRWREQLGDQRSALAAVRRRLGGVQNPHFTLLQPAFLREEGRLAALTGDTAAAIRAYRHYLTLRDEPDPGPIHREVLRVRTLLAELERSAWKGTFEPGRSSARDARLYSWIR